MSTENQEQGRNGDTAPDNGTDTFICDGCGGSLHYKPGTGHMTCPYCGALCEIKTDSDEISELDYRENLQSARNQAELEEHITVTCNGCGARTDLQPNITAGHCPFCDSPLVAQHVSEKRFKPRSLLPFGISRDTASDLFREWIASRWFAPSSFKRDVKAERLNGVYCPFWTYDAATRTDYTGQRGEYYYVTRTYTVTVNGKRQTRTRRERRTRWYPASGSVDNSFDDILIRASRGLPERLAEKLEPWDLHTLRPYQPEFLSGFTVESYTVGLEEGFNGARERMKPTIRTTVKRHIGGDTQRIHSMSTAYNRVTFKHILLPVWISAYRFKAKTYRFLVNANTGEVQGERLYSVWKIFLASLAVAAAAAGVFLLLMGP